MLSNELSTMLCKCGFNLGLVKPEKARNVLEVTLNIPRVSAQVISRKLCFMSPSFTDEEAGL